jgi:hypothetical protein
MGLHDQSHEYLFVTGHNVVREVLNDDISSEVLEVPRYMPEERCGNMIYAMR